MLDEVLLVDFKLSWQIVLIHQVFVESLSVNVQLVHKQLKMEGSFEALYHLLDGILQTLFESVVVVVGLVQDHLLLLYSVPDLLEHSLLAPNLFCQEQVILLLLLDLLLVLMLQLFLLQL